MMTNKLMCFLVSFSKFIVVPILSWLEIPDFIFLEIALCDSKNRLAQFTSEYPDLFGQSLFISFESIRLSRSLALWYTNHGLRCNTAEAVIGPSILRSCKSKCSILKWLTGRHVNRTFHVAALDCMQSIKRVRFLPSCSRSSADVLQYMQSLERLTVDYLDPSVRNIVPLFQMLTSFTSRGRISVDLIAMLCQLPNLIEVHLLDKSRIEHARVLFASPRLTALTVWGSCELDNATLSSVVVKCKLKYLCSDMLIGSSFLKWEQEGGVAELTSLNLLSEHDHGFTSGDELFLICGHCPQLTDLTLPRCYLPDALVTNVCKNLPQLVALHMRYFVSLTNECLEQIARHCPLIVRLSIPSELPALVHFLTLEYLVVGTSLVGIYLNSCSLLELKHIETDRMGAHTLSYLALYCTKLEVIRLTTEMHDFRHLRVDEQLLALCKRQDGLLELRIGGSLSCGTLAALLQNCPKLVTFYGNADGSMTKEGLKTLIPSMARLRVLGFVSAACVWSVKRLRFLVETCRRMETFSLVLRGRQWIPLSRSIPEMKKVNPDLTISIDN